MLNKNSLVKRLAAGLLTVFLYGTYAAEDRGSALPPPFTAVEHQTNANLVCVSNLYAIARAALEYAAVHKSHMPTNLILLRGFLDDPTKLVCPADTVRAKPVSTNWQDFKATMITYRLMSQPIKTNDGNRLYLVCSQHQNTILNNGIVGVYRKSR